VKEDSAVLASTKETKLELQSKCTIEEAAEANKTQNGDFERTTVM
jgi:hypothetical protein